MTKRDVVSIALKVLGVICVVFAVMSIPNIGLAIIMLLQSSENTEQYWVYFWYLAMSIASPILVFTISYILLKKGDSIAEKLVRKDSKLSIEGPEEWERRVFVLSLRIVGVVCIIMGIPKAINNAWKFTFMLWVGNPYEWAGFFSAIVFVILGIYLLSGGRVIVKLTFPEQETESR